MKPFGLKSVRHKSLQYEAINAITTKFVSLPTKSSFRLNLPVNASGKRCSTFTMLPAALSYTKYKSIKELKLLRFSEHAYTENKINYQLSDIVAAQIQVYMTNWRRPVFPSAF